MKLSQLNKKVTFEEKVTVKKPGSHYDTWNDVFTTWASIRPIIGKEYLEARQIKNEVTAKIKIRYKAGLSPNMRIKSNEKSYEILSMINVNEANAEIVFYVKEVV